jgi:hypothetical protein
MRFPAAFAAIFALTLPGTSLCWDQVGHMLVDQIAYDNVTPSVRTKVEKLVQQLDNTYNDGIPYNFITAGAWMDDMRGAPNYQMSKWHYIDIEYTSTGTPAVIPPPPNLLSAFDEAVATLRKPGSPQAKRAEALAIVMHLVGDVHQPMHCVDWEDDRGGNAYLIYGIPFSDLLKKYLPNLHAYWDKAFRFDVEGGKIVEVYFAPSIPERPRDGNKGLIKSEADRLALQFPKSALFQLEGQPTVLDWARDTHTVACLFAYPIRPHPTENEVVTLTPDYVRHARAVANQRIALAGYRLASLLEALFRL